MMEKVKQNFLKHNAFQCGFCSPGMLMTTKEILLNKKNLTRDEIRSEISGNYCRCTGYQSIVDAIEECINEINKISKIINKEELIELEPQLKEIQSELSGGLLFSNDEVGDAYKFCKILEERIRNNGGRILTNTNINKLSLIHI